MQWFIDFLHWQYNSLRYIKAHEYTEACIHLRNFPYEHDDELKINRICITPMEQCAFEI